MLTHSRYHLAAPSHTFHGRDIFAPVAAHLATGVALEELGPPLSTDTLSLPSIKRQNNRITGSVIHIDHFGNLITNIHRHDLGHHHNRKIEIKALDLIFRQISQTFADVPIGDALAYLGSDNFLELAVRNGNAA